MDFKKWKLNIPLLTAVIICLSLAKQFIYYNSFKIPIGYFLSLADVGLLVSEQLLLVVSIVTIPILIMFIIAELLEHRTSRRMDSKVGLASDELEGSKAFSTLFNKDFRLVSGWILIVSAILSVIFSSVFYSYGNSSYSTLIIQIGISILFLFFGVLSIFIKTYEETYKSKIPLGYVAVFVAFLYSSIALTIVTSTEIRSVKNGAYNGTTIIRKDKSKFVSSDSFYFVGKSDKYIFFYNSFDTSSFVQPIEEIESIVFKLK